MEYAAEVAVVFRDEPKVGVFEIWRVVVVFESVGTRQALKDAISITREKMGAPSKLQAIGYTEKPVVYAVLSLNDLVGVEAPDAPRPHYAGCFIVLGMTSFSQSQLDRLTARVEVPSAFSAIWVEE